MASILTRPSIWLTVGGISAAGSAYMARSINTESLPFLSKSLSKSVSFWRVLAILFALLNIKTLFPFAWHLRLLRGLLRHVSLRRSYCPPSPGPSALFQPVITSSHTPLLEIDYNLHKSNSTYFLDLDVARMNHVACLFKHGLHRAHYGTAKKADGTPRGRLGVMLGGVTCSFKREIKAYAGYEIWTRVLSWDRKWLYMVSHIVEKGRVLPRGYTLQPWRRDAPPRSASTSNGRANGAANGRLSAGGKAADKASAPHPAIYATSVAKYVFKEGRVTIPPEQVLEFSDLLPPKPAEHETPPRTKSPEGEASAVEGVVIDSMGAATSDDKAEMADDDGAWTWERMERERDRGMVLAQNMANLDDLHWEFTGEKEAALGRY